MIELQNIGTITNKIMVKNYCSNLLKESKTRHFNYLNFKDITEN